MNNIDINWGEIIGRFFKRIWSWLIDRWDYGNGGVETFLILTVITVLSILFTIGLLKIKGEDNKLPQLPTAEEIAKIEREIKEMKMEREAKGLAVIFKKTLSLTPTEVGYILKGKKEIWAEAVDRGYGEWVVIDNEGNTEFKWKEI